MFSYPVKIEAEKTGGFFITFPDVPEAMTQGDTRAEVLKNAVEALETALSFYIESDRPLPKASAARGRKTVTPSLICLMKLHLYAEMQKKNITITQLAKKMGCDRKHIYRLLDTVHDSRVDQLESAFSAMGRRVHIEMQTA